MYFPCTSSVLRTSYVHGYEESVSFGHPAARRAASLCLLLCSVCGVAAGRGRHKKSVSSRTPGLSDVLPCTSRGPSWACPLDVHGYEESVSFGHLAAQRAARLSSLPPVRPCPAGALLCHGGRGRHKKSVSSRTPAPERCTFRAHPSSCGRRMYTVTRNRCPADTLPGVCYPCTSRAGPVGPATLDVHGYEESVSCGHLAARP